MKRILSLMLCAVICLGMLSGCAFDISQAMKDQAACFAEGKNIGEPILLGADEAMLEMLDKYNGSLYIPELRSMPESVPDDSDGQIFTISCDDDLMQVLADAYLHTRRSVKIRCENNYLEGTTKKEKGVVINRLHAQIRRANPLHASSVRAWNWIDNCLYIYYYCDVKTVQKRNTETMQLVKEKADQIRQVATTEYEMIFEVNRLLCNEVTYAEGTSPYPAETHTPYGALKNRVAVCDGYTTAAMLILRELGIESDMQHGFGITKVRVPKNVSQTVTTPEKTDIADNDGSGKDYEIITRREPHAWNLVCLNNRWYHMDITWNDTPGSLYEYFLVSDVFMTQTHDWDYSQYPETPWLRYHP